MNKINKFYKKNKLKLIVVVFIIIPILIGFVGGTLGYVDKGILGALAGFIRYFFYFYGYCIILWFWCWFIYEYFVVKWELTLMIIIYAILFSLLIFIIWLLNNY